MIANLCGVFVATCFRHNAKCPGHRETTGTQRLRTVEPRNGLEPSTCWLRISGSWPAAGSSSCAHVLQTQLSTDLGVFVASVSKVRGYPSIFQRLQPPQWTATTTRTQNCRFF